MWGSSHWMHFGLGESAARRTRKRDGETGESYTGDKPDGWKAQDGILPSVPEDKPKVEGEKKDSPEAK